MKSIKRRLVEVGLQLRRLEKEQVPEELIELKAIYEACESPLTAYARHLERLKQVGMDYWADYLRFNYPVSKLFKLEIAYRKRTWKNYILSIQGAQGTLKSLSGITIAQWIDPDFVGKRGGRVYLPKIFWTDEDLIEYARTEAKPGDVLLKDEDPRYMGAGAATIENAIRNLEGTQRFNEINFIFIYVVGRSHYVHTVLYTRGEHFTRPRNKLEAMSPMARKTGLIADYSVLGVLQPLAGFSEYTLCGLMKVDVPDQAIINEYHKRKREFTEEMLASGGLGPTRSPREEFEWLIKELENDEDFQRLDSRGAMASYIHFKYRLPYSLISALMPFVPPTKAEMGESVL
jgi:hypothetical protein